MQRRREAAGVCALPKVLRGPVPEQRRQEERGDQKPIAEGEI